MVTAADRIIFAAVNAWIYLRHPRFTAVFWRKRHAWPDFATPSRQSELVQWRKLFDRNPLFPVFSDKLATRDWVAARAPDLPMAEVVWTGTDPDRLPKELITPGYVIKLNTESGKNHFPGKHPISSERLLKRLRFWMSRGLRRRYATFRAGLGEWAYRPVRRQLMVERLVQSEAPLLDIAVRCVAGRPRQVVVTTDFKTREGRIAYFRPDGARIRYGGPVAQLAEDFRAPLTLPRAVDYAAQLSEGLDYVRVDFFSADDQLLFGEMTIYPSSGHGADDALADALYRDWINHLQLSWFFTTPHPWPLSLYQRALARWLRAKQAEISTLPPIELPLQ